MSTLNHPDPASQLASTRWWPELATIPPHPPLGQLPPLERRPSSPVTLPSFKSLDSMIRGCSPPQNGPLSSSPHPKPWKPEDMVVEQPSASPTLAGQQLHVPAPGLPTGYPGMRLLRGNTKRKSRVEIQIKQAISLEFNGERVTQQQNINDIHFAPVKRYKMPPAAITAHNSNPAVPLQPRTPRTDSVSDSDSDSDLCPLRLEIGGLQSKRIRRIRRAKSRASGLPGLPSLYLLEDLPCLNPFRFAGTTTLLPQPRSTSSTTLSTTDRLHGSTVLSRSQALRAFVEELEGENTNLRRELDLLHASPSRAPPFVHPAHDCWSPDSNSDHYSHSIQHRPGLLSPHQVAGPPFSQKGKVSSDGSASSYSHDTFFQLPSTSMRTWSPSTASSLPQSQQGLSRPTSPTSPTLPRKALLMPTSTPASGVDWTTRSFMPLGSSPPGPLTLPPSPSFPIPSTQLPPFSTPIYPPGPGKRTATQVVGGTPPSIPEQFEKLEKLEQFKKLEQFEKMEKALQSVSKPAYLMLSISAALLNVNDFSNNSITRLPLMIATATSFSAVMIHWLASLQLHVSQSAHNIKRPLVVLVAFLAVSVFATLFALPAHSWSQAECGSYCWAERALVSTVVAGGLASLTIGGWRMRGGDGRLAARVDWS